MVRQRVIDHRDSGQLYPIYITDIELEDQDFIGHLHTKFRLETQLSAYSKDSAKDGSNQDSSQDPDQEPGADIIRDPR